MEIRWLGNSTFEVRSSVGVVIIDHPRPLPKASKLEDEKTKKIHLVCLQAEEERKEQEKNRRLKSKAGKLGALKRWSTETLKEDD